MGLEGWHGIGNDQLFLIGNQLTLYKNVRATAPR